MADNKFGFGSIKEKIRQMKEILPAQLANQAQNYFVASWTKQGWDGKKWETPQRKIQGTSEYKYPKKKGLGRRTRATLVQTGDLRRRTANSIRSAKLGREGVRLVVDLPYAAIHNDGGPMANGGKMPQRTFMKDSPILRVQQREKIKLFTDKVWGKAI